MKNVCFWLIFLAFISFVSCNEQSYEDTSSKSGPSDVGTMVLIPAGTFKMGCSVKDDGEYSDLKCITDEKPNHDVTLSAFEIDKYEVTNGQYVEFLNEKGNSCYDNECIDIESNGAKIEKKGDEWLFKKGYEFHPVVNVTWFGAKAFCEWAEKRLPTEAEWEMAARGDDGRIYPWGNEPATCNYAVMTEADSGSGCDKGLYWAVGSRPDGKSPFGVHDMAGNAMEWVSDFYEKEYYTDSPEENPTGPENGDQKVLRGGSWFMTFGYSLRSSSRNSSSPELSYNIYGFRCAK